MYLLFEESGQFKTGTILSEAETSLQVESSSGKRIKIKRANVIFTFKDVSPLHLLDQANELSKELDIEFLWEISPKETFNVTRLAKEYYGDDAGTVEQTALLLFLHDHPMYFHRKGKGLYAPAPEEILQAAKLAQEKKRLQAEQQQQWTQDFVKGIVPEELRSIMPSFLTNPDKNTIAWKAFADAVNELGIQVPELLLKLNVFPNALAVHRQKFLAIAFPRGTANPEIPIPPIEDLPTATVEAFSVDDISTTEVDDAFSIQHLGDNQYIFGIHIACPALVIDRDSPLDLAARKRMSTVYFPGDKIPMQHEDVIKTFSLDAGKHSPALSLYVTADIATGEILNEETKLERVFIKENLRNNYLEDVLTAEALESTDADIPYAELFKPMWRFSKFLRAKRDERRGKPEKNDRVEYLFRLEGSPDDPDSIITLDPRVRNAPIDLLVAEFMILCNSTWAKLLASLGLPGIFRSQQQFGRVRMSTHALPHHTIGVEQYAWTSSPLRRYVDLFNQRQLIAAVKHGVSARLVAPYKPKEIDIFSIISQFESIYTLYLTHQARMERFWCLRYIQQQHLSEVEATVIREELVRLKDIPITTSIAGLPELEKGTSIRIAIDKIDLYNLTFEARLLKILDTAIVDVDIEDDLSDTLPENLSLDEIETEIEVDSSVESNPEIAPNPDNILNTSITAEINKKD
ncbi:ribonuclease II [Pelistega indica]|uniref:Ribonuclease II n=1 Tax=Pelistega indica TaxID=1414851 RepID=V8G880_9BURK|nr:ribonuclease catalytic domain-containing protein [Pelistega indica]ETD72158.1 ribonuclease II [Pelistega indica]